MKNLRYQARRAAVHLYGTLLRTSADRAGSLEALVQVAMDLRLTPLRITPFQDAEELVAFLRVVRDLSPRTVLEIGTARGGSLFLLCRTAHPEATLVSVDLPRGKFSGGYADWLAPLYRSFSAGHQSIELVRGDSHSQETLSQVRRHLREAPVDLLFIDGDHSAAGVRLDFEMYSPLVREGGLIAFHDISPGRVENVGGVPEFWQEIRSSYRTREIVGRLWREGFGIGLLWK